jgi:hypothetical protein
MHAIEHGRQASKAGAVGWLSARHPGWAELLSRAVRITEGRNPALETLGREELEQFLTWCRHAQLRQVP